MAQRNRRTPLKPGKCRTALTITHPNAAGIDIGNASHFVAVPPDRDDEPVREFPSFTDDLNALADWLTACGVDTVAMESTGVYWIPLFELLESRGFTVLLVNARHVKNVSGRKSDVLDCQWLQQLMTYGLLSGAFRPTDAVCALRSLWRQRGMLLRSQGRHVQHMQKALTQMNVQLATRVRQLRAQVSEFIGSRFKNCHYNKVSCSGSRGFSRFNAVKIRVCSVLVVDSPALGWEPFRVMR